MMNHAARYRRDLHFTRVRPTPAIKEDFHAHTLQRRSSADLYRLASIAAAIGIAVNASVSATIRFARTSRIAAAIDPLALYLDLFVRIGSWLAAHDRVLLHVEAGDYLMIRRC